ncbi:hypothetical protein D0868_01090 [Hortaea werneckii]|uniref:Zn(2)-C6 fungal-type domain-containing protein n=1 Tax=Hortaea werneckii TaxID=91943 RepID=A0A3M6ZIW4_HORWE|nr:hypothetical protein D0868_01090 [Hortaea werneckii]
MPPRPLRPKDEPGAPDGVDAASEPKTNKRRAVSSACIPCRKRKSKCDGSVPACSTCTAVYRTECSYDADSDHRRKGALKRDLQSLQQQNNALDVVVASLRTLPEGEAVALLHSLRSDANPDELATSLRTNVRLPHSYAPQTLEADFAQQLSTTPTSTSFDSAGFTSSREQSLDDTALSLTTTMSNESSGVWFRQPQDVEFVEHLLNLHFCWIHPFYHFFHREYFLHDMSRGNTEFCSALLVNAICSFACHYSDRPAARAEATNPATAGDAFFAEAKRLLERTEKSSLTTVQALGIMSARECSHGRDSNAYQLAGRCLRMALELGLHLSVIGSGLRASEVEVRKITFWGVFNLETACSVAFGRLSQLPRAAADIQKPSVNDRSEALTWRPYEDTNLSLSPSAEQPARPMLYVHHMSTLSELASDMVNTFYAPQERFTSRRLAATYKQYQEWYANLPDAFRLENTSLPHVLVLHMYYYACVLHLFRPYIKLDLRGAGLFPRDTCTFCANEISALMNALRAMYGLRRVCLAVSSFLMSASTIHLLNLPSESASAHLGQGLSDLQAMSVNHQFAARCVDIIRSLANKWNIALPDSAASVNVLRGTGGARGWPSPPSSTFFAASIPRKHSSESGTRSDGSMNSAADGPFKPPRPTPTHHLSSFYSDSGGTPVDGVRNNHQPNAFWTPFPVQGVPSQPQGWNDMVFDFNQPVDGVNHWPMFGSSAGPTVDGHAPTMNATSPMDHAMGGPMSEWNWQ